MTGLEITIGKKYQSVMLPAAQRLTDIHEGLTVVIPAGSKDTFVVEGLKNRIPKDVKEKIRAELRQEFYKVARSLQK